VKIVLDTTILVRANERTKGLARELLIHIVESAHQLLLSNEMLPPVSLMSFIPAHYYDYRVMQNS
jgi:predicted nucleic acid-binding protein